MGKALLTDEIIERANHGEDISGPPLMDDEETKIFFNWQKLPLGRSSLADRILSLAIKALKTALVMKKLGLSSIRVNLAIRLLKTKRSLRMRLCTLSRSNRD